MKLLNKGNRISTWGKGKEGAQPKSSVTADVYAAKVEKKAYELYEQRGRQDGNDLNDWYEAERIVEQEMISGQ